MQGASNTLKRGVVPVKPELKSRPLDQNLPLCFSKQSSTKEGDIIPPQIHLADHLPDPQHETHQTRSLAAPTPNATQRGRGRGRRQGGSMSQFYRDSHNTQGGNMASGELSRPPAQLSERSSQADHAGTFGQVDLEALHLNIFLRMVAMNPGSRSRILDSMSRSERSPIGGVRGARFGVDSGPRHNINDEHNSSRDYGSSRSIQRPGNAGRSRGYQGQNFLTPEQRRLRGAQDNLMHPMTMEQQEAMLTEMYAERVRNAGQRSNPPARLGNSAQPTVNGGAQPENFGDAQMYG